MLLSDCGAKVEFADVDYKTGNISIVNFSKEDGH